MILKDVSCIPRCARPEHRALRLIGGVIELVDAQHGGHTAADGRVLLRRYIARQRDDEPQARLSRRMLVRRIYRGGIAKEH